MRSTLAAPSRAAAFASTGGLFAPLSAVDLLICATAVHHDLIVLHDDSDFVTAARHLPDLRERTIHDTPEAG
jgi:predicted nucleic acid-binding protein